MKKKFTFIIAFFLLVVFFFCSIFSMHEKSPIFDEPVHLAAGYSYLKTGDYRMNIEHPPLLKLLAGIPLLFLNASLPLEHHSWSEIKEWSFGDQFFYHNRVNADKLLYFGRIPTILLSLLLGFFVFHWTKKLYSANAGIFALFLYVFSPNIIAHSQLITTDLASSCFIFLSVCTFWDYLKNPVRKNLVFAGISLGLALASKFTTVILFPIYFFLFIFSSWKKKIDYRIILSFLGFFLIAGFILFAAYKFSKPEYYFLGLKSIILEAGKKGLHCFLFGKYSNTGWRYYYLVCFFLKTPLALLFLFLFSLFYTVKKRKIRLPYYYFPLVPIILIFLSASFSLKQLGLRYILPIYPFVFLFTSGVVTEIKGKWIKVVTVVLSSWYLFSFLKISPHYLSYFNELAGGPENGWKYLIDSNIDWGQDLKGLKKYIETEEVSDIILSYCGNADPNYYGISYQDLGTSSMFRRKSKINQLNPKKEILAISVNNLQSLFFYDERLFNWLKKIKPEAKIGYSIFIYDITANVYVHEYLAQIYYNNGWEEETLRECKILISIEPDNTVAHFVLGCFYAEKGKTTLATEYYEKSLQYNPAFLPELLSLVNYSSYNLHATREAKPEFFCMGLFSLGDIYFAQKKYESAIAIYQKIGKIYPDLSEVYGNLGSVYIKLGRNKEAIASCQKAIEIDPKYAPAYFTLSEIYWKEKRWGKAIEQLEKVLQINPNYPDAEKYLTLAREKMSRYMRRL